jgi:hypothetical protein
VGDRGHRKGQLRVLGSPSALHTKEPRTGGSPGGRGVRGPVFFLRKPHRTYLGVLKPDCRPPGPIGNILGSSYQWILPAASSQQPADQPAASSQQQPAASSQQPAAQQPPKNALWSMDAACGPVFVYFLASQGQTGAQRPAARSEGPEAAVLAAVRPLGSVRSWVKLSVVRGVQLGPWAAGLGGR